jgi:hypothetical protein
MSVTNPYFIRHQPGDTPGNNGGSFSSCPDIIFSTAGPPNYAPPQSADPKTFLTAASYGTDYGSTVQVSPAGNVNNFVYLRALNTNPSANVPLRFWMMYTQSNLALWPQNWRRDSIKVGQNFQNYQDGTLIVSGGPGPYVVTGQPFLWSPTGPASGTHYCVISMVEPFPNADPPLSDPPFAPPSSIGYLSSVEQLAAFVLANDWFGWRNTIDVTSLGATWQQTIPVTGPDQAGQVMVGVACSNMPTDGYVAAYMQGPDVQNTLNLPKSPITTPNMQLTVTLNLPASYKTNMIITYWQGSTTPPYLANIAPFLGLPSGALAGLLRANQIKRAPRYVPELDPVTNELMGWKRVHVFGSAPYTWETPPQQKKGLVAGSPPLDEVVGSVKDSGATWQQSYPVEAPSSGAFWAGYQTFNMPTDGQIALDIIGPNAGDSVSLPPTPISEPNQLTLASLQWPPGFQGTMTISYWQGATPPPPGAKIEPVVEIPDDSTALGQDEPTWEQTFPITGPESAASVFVGIQCTNMPTDGFVAMSLEPGNANIPKWRISTPNLQMLVPFDMPANYSGQMLIKYWRGATVPPLGASIKPVVAIPAVGG